MTTTAADDFNVVSPVTNPGQTAADDFNVLPAGAAATEILNLSATALNGAAQLFWTPPPGVNVSSYVVTATASNITRQYRLPGGDTTDTLLQLTNGLAWNVEVATVAGGATSQPVGVYVTPAAILTSPANGIQPSPSVPDPPRVTTVLSGDRGATVTWVSPVYSGGSPITGYRVTAVDTNGIFVQVIADITNSAAIFANLALTNGVIYSVTVQAGNSAYGFSPPSNAMLAAPVTGGPVIDPPPPPVIPPPAANQTQPVFYAFPADKPFTPSNWQQPQGA